MAMISKYRKKSNGKSDFYCTSLNFLSKLKWYRHSESHNIWSKDSGRSGSGQHLIWASVASPMNVPMDKDADAEFGCDSNPTNTPCTTHVPQPPEPLVLKLCHWPNFDPFPIAATAGGTWAGGCSRTRRSSSKIWPQRWTRLLTPAHQPPAISPSLHSHSWLIFCAHCRLRRRYMAWSYRAACRH